MNADPEFGDGLERRGADFTDRFSRIADVVGGVSADEADEIEIRVMRLAGRLGEVPAGDVGDKRSID